MIKQCVICRETILEEDSYFKVELFVDRKSRGIDYAHQLCWVRRNNEEENIKKLTEGALRLLESDEINNSRDKVITIR